MYGFQIVCEIPMRTIEYQIKICVWITKSLNYEVVGLSEAAPWSLYVTRKRYDDCMHMTTVAPFTDMDLL